VSSSHDRKATAREQSRDERARSREQSRERRIEERGRRRRERRTDDEPPGPIWTRPEPGARRARLTREEIAQAALQIADADGIDALSMRRVASDLGVGTMSLYYYVQTKAELLDLMHDAMIGEVIVPDDELPRDWRGALELIARRALAAIRRHPWSLAGPIATPGPNALRHFDQSLAAVSELDLDLQARFEIILMVDDYVFGYALREAEDQREETAWDESQLDETIAAYFDAQLATGGYPQIEKLRAEQDPHEVMRKIRGYARDPERFERGLKRLLDGIALELGGAVR
jgi:AcrR family transcriptional regulator